MKTTSALRSLTATALIFGSLFATTPSARADWPAAHWHITITPAYPVYPSAPVCPPPSRPASPVHGSDYQPELAQSYRQGWMAGQMARAYGWPRDTRSAFLASGCGWESYFQEGYADGYDGRHMQH